MEASFNHAFTLLSISNDDSQTNDQTKMANAYRSFADEGYRSVATEDQTKMDMKNQSSASGKSTLAIKTGPKMSDLRIARKREMVRCRVCGEQGHNRRSCFKFLSFKESISRR